MTMTSGETDGWYSDDVATFGDRVGAAREALHMSVEDLARRIGVRPGTIRDWENDQSEPRANKLQMLSGVLNVSLKWMLTGEGEGLPAPGDVEPIPAETEALLAEMRQLRGELDRSVERLAILEKRLRQSLGRAA